MTKVLEVLIEPLLEYWHAMCALFSRDHLDHLVERIVSDEMDVAQLVKLFVSSIVISTLI